ncbi:D-glucuronyl C5-epimerase [Schistosoma japonicum]|nr:D-glucuronyl C5-epimerase [Schistosoma japonicum]
MQFHKLNVEKRNHVKLIIADEGVPISQQWNSHGYPYPIQIAQFGLNHFSQLAVADQMNSKNVNDILSFDDANMGLNLIIPSSNVSHRWINQKLAYESSDKLILSANKIDSIGRVLSITPKLQGWDYFIMVGHQWTYGSFVELSLLWYPPKTVGINNYPTKILVVYNCSAYPSRYQTYATIFNNSIVTYWMPECENEAKIYGFIDSIRLSRDIYTDLMKVFYPYRKSPEYADMSSLNITNTTSNPFFSHVQILEINFYVNPHNDINDIIVEKLYLGKSTSLHSSSSSLPPVNKMTLTEKLFHEIRFTSAADWFIKHQDKHGGWSVNVQRFLNGRKALRPGWYSAMGQGQAISLLIRAYSYTGNRAYLEACHRALNLFNIQVNHGGVRSYFLNQSNLIWFEEYPFDPPIHILNGFIYSLFGLYDYTKLLMSSPDPLISPYLTKAQNLLDAGLTSLSKLLPLFDSGSGSFYDLRHLSADYNYQSMKLNKFKSSKKDHFQLSSGPNRARWSYHAVHIKQLLTLVDLDPKHAIQWHTTATRWIAYLQGFTSLQN